MLAMVPALRDAQFDVESLTRSTHGRENRDTGRNSLHLIAKNPRTVAPRNEPDRIITSSSNSSLGYRSFLNIVYEFILDLCKINLTFFWNGLFL